MEKEKNLLYYINSKKVPKHYEGEPIFEDNFKNVETGADLIAYSSNAWKKLREAGYQVNSSDPETYEKKYYILWKKLQQNDIISIRPLETSYDCIKKEYDYLINTKKNREEVILELLSKYNRLQDSIVTDAKGKTLILK